MIHATNTGETKPMDQILVSVNGLSSAEPAENLILNPLDFLTQHLLIAGKKAPF